MIFLGVKSLDEIKESVINAVKNALKSFKDEDAEVIGLTASINDLKKNLRTTKDELEDVKSKKKIELMEIEHLVKMKEEKNAIELEKKIVAMQKEFNEKEVQLLKNHQEKTLEMIATTKREFNDLYKEILSRLPNINATVEFGGTGKKKESK